MSLPVYAHPTGLPADNVVQLAQLDAGTNRYFSDGTVQFGRYALVAFAGTSASRGGASMGVYQFGSLVTTWTMPADWVFLQTM